MTRINPKKGEKHFGTRVNSDRGRTWMDPEERSEMYAKFAVLYEEQHLSDLQIAEQCGVADRTVRRWRYRTGRPNQRGELYTGDTF